MKIAHHVLLIVACAFLWSGCGGGANTEKVDVQAQIQNLKSDNAETRQNACVELAKAGEDAAPAVPALIPLLKDGDALVRRLAAYALGQIGPKAKQAVPALKELLNDSERDVITATVNAIRAIDETAANTMAPPPNVSN
jgi:HEAT repeat protein